MVTDTKSGPGDLFTFANWVHKDGYEIAPALSPRGAVPARSTSDVLRSVPAERQINPRGIDKRRSHPLTESDSLARTFAGVGDAESDVLAFVNRFGLLHPHERAYTNTLEAFFRSRDVVRTTLKRIDRATRQTLDAHERRDNLRDLSDWFNREAAGAFTFTLRIPSARSSDRALRVAPTSLLSAIGLLLAYEISGEIEWKHCAQCGVRFPAGAPGDRVRRRDAETCSQECTQSLLDARKAAKRVTAPLSLAPRVCAHCGEQFVPKRDATVHCGKPACKMAVSRAKKAAQPATTKGTT